MNTPRSTPTPGTRVALAIEQLHMAIDLFLTNRSHASALTLGGAAEVVLAQQAERFGATPTLENQYKIIAKLLAKNNRRIPPIQAFFKECNTLRNQLKHFDREDTEWLDGSVTQGAVQMIGRACNNYELCGLPPTEQMQEFYDWYYSQIICPPNKR